MAIHQAMALPAEPYVIKNGVTLHKYLEQEGDTGYVDLTSSETRSPALKEIEDCLYYHIIVPQSPPQQKYIEVCFHPSLKERFFSCLPSSKVLLGSEQEFKILH